MANHIYIAGAEQGSGKSSIALALMESLHATSASVGFFRPVIRSEDRPDHLIQLMTLRYQLTQDYVDSYGCTQETAAQYLRQDRYADLIKLILTKFRSLAEQFDMVVCVGSDYRSAGAVLEFDFNIDMANNLGCMLVPVVCGFNRNEFQMTTATDSVQKLLKEDKADILLTVINRVDNDKLQAIKQRLSDAYDHEICVIPDMPGLGHATVADVSRALQAQAVYMGAESMGHEIHCYKIAAMGVRDMLTHLEPGCFLITSGDRADVVLAALLSYQSSSCPQISGILLTGGISPGDSVKQLLDGLGDLPFAILSVHDDTYAAVMKVNAIEVEITADNERKIAMALGGIESQLDMQWLQQKILQSNSMRVTPLMFEYEIVQQARKSLQHIVLPEGEEERILHAAERLLLRGVCKLTLLGDEEKIRNKIAAMDLQLDGINVINPLTDPRRELYAQTYYTLRKHKGISEQMAFDTLADVSYFGTMMVYNDHADGMVSGSVHTTQHTIRPAFETIKTAPGAKIVSSVFFMCLEDKVLVYGDCAINPNPNAEQLADIAVSSAATAQKFGISPCVAMLSYSTGKSGKGEDVDKVREATEIVRRLQPDLLVEGPIQYDAAVDAKVAKTKLPDSHVAGKASVFIFPDLNTGNNTYKAVQRSSGAVAIGPILQGLKKPVNDLSRGCTVTDIVNTVVITAIQAQSH